MRRKEVMITKVMMRRMVIWSPETKVMILRIATQTSRSWRMDRSIDYRHNDADDGANGWILPSWPRFIGLEDKLHPGDRIEDIRFDSKAKNLCFASTILRDEFADQWSLKSLI